MPAVASVLPKRNGWTVAEHVGDRTPDKTQRLPNRAFWDKAEAMTEIRRFAVAGLEEAAGRPDVGAGSWWLRRWTRRGNRRRASPPRVSSGSMWAALTKARLIRAAGRAGRPRKDSNRPRFLRRPPGCAVAAMM
jgi:hypothetical protein